MHNKEMSLVCAWCGETFIYSRKKKYCSEKCRNISYGRGTYEDIIKTKRKIISTTTEVEKIAKLARESGLSYGKYVAKYGI